MLSIYYKFVVVYKISVEKKVEHTERLWNTNTNRKSR